MTGQRIDCISLQSQPLRASNKRRSSVLPRHAFRLILEQSVARVFLIAGEELWLHTRGHPRVALARQAAMYLAHVVCGLSLTQVGAVFTRDRTTVAHACWVIEDLREDPTFDRSLDLLESVLRLLSRSPAALPAARG